MAAAKVLSLLQERNARQTTPFVNIFAHRTLFFFFTPGICQLLVDHALFIKTQQLERELKARPTHAAPSSGAADDPVQVAKLKEELTMCYKY